MRIPITLLLVCLVQVSVCSSPAVAAGTPKQKKAVAPASSAVSDFVLHLTSNYCDTALPYTYWDKNGDTGPILRLWPHPSPLKDDPIFSKYKQVYESIDADVQQIAGAANATTDDAKAKAYSDAMNQFYNSTSLPGLADMKVDDRISWSESPLTIFDRGDPILGQADLELGPDGYDAARLLVRTLQPSLVANACNPKPTAS